MTGYGTISHNISLHMCIISYKQNVLIYLENVLGSVLSLVSCLNLSIKYSVIKYSNIITIIFVILVIMMMIITIIIIVIIIIIIITIIIIIICKSTTFLPNIFNLSE